MHDGIVFHMAAEEKVKCMYIHTRIMIYVRYGEEVFQFVDVKTCLFPYLSNHALLPALSIINETAWQVECTLGGVFGTTGHQQLALAIQDKCSS